MLSALRVMAVASALLLTACGNSGSDSSGNVTVPPPAGATYTIGGTVSGVTGAGLVLSNNGATLPVGAGATTFAFTTGFATGTAYNVMAQSSPAGLLCSVANGSGTVGSANVNNIAVTCTAQNHSVGGTLSGLTANGLVLANNGATVTLNAGATGFTFPTLIATGTAYAVTVQTAPAGFTCSVANGTGTMGTADISNVVVTCSTQAYSVGGSIAGYTSTGLVIANGTDRIAPGSGATSFSMPTIVASGSSYNVTIAVQPAGMSCSVANGMGTVGNAMVTNVAITCTDQSYKLGGTISGLGTAGLVLANGSDTVTVTANATSFTLPTAVAYGTPFAVTVATQPSGLTCTVSGGSGTMPANNVNNIAVACSAQTYTLGGNISGLTVAGLVLGNTDGQSVTVPANAPNFVFANGLAVGAPYAVTVTTQPNGWTCTVGNGTGNMPAANVTGVQVTCATASYTLGGSITGLVSSGLVLANGTDTVPVAANAASFTLPTAVAVGATYTVTVQTQPIGLMCTVTDGTATMPASDVTSVQVACAVQWTWLTGSNTAGAPGVSSGTTPPITPGARDSAMAWSDSSGNYWLFGGSGLDVNGTSGALSDVWEYNPGTSTWALVAGSPTADTPNGQPGAAPGGRSEGMVWTDGAGNLWLFGGYGTDYTGVQGAFADLWEFNMGTKQWSFIGGPGSAPDQTGQPGTYGTLGMFSYGWPGGREAAATWTDSGGNLWMFGGQSSSGVYNDLWMYKPGQGWTWMGGSNTTGGAGVYGPQGGFGTGNIPSARFGAMIWKDPSGNVWLYGGTQPDPTGPNGLAFLGDLWEFNANGWAWVGGGGASGVTTDTAGVYGMQGVAAAGNLPGARGGAVAWADSAGNLWMFGGAGYANSNTTQYELDDLWVYNTTSQQWTWVNGGQTVPGGVGNPGSYGAAGTAGNQPGGRFAASGWTDGNGHFWLFGGSGVDGSGNAGDLNDLWVY